MGKKGMGKKGMGKKGMGKKGMGKEGMEEEGMGNVGCAGVPGRASCLKRRSAHWRLGLSALVAALSAIAFSTSPVYAAQITHPFLGSFGPDGTERTTFSKPGAIGIDQSTGDVYAADLQTGKVYKFGPEGEPREFSALGSNELTGFSFEPGQPAVSEIAVDPSTHIFYVADFGPGSNSVKAFHADGEPAVFAATGTNELTAGFDEVCGVAVDPVGNIYVGDFAGIKVLSPTGEPITSFSKQGACNVAVDSTGSIYAAFFKGELHKFVPSVYPPTPSTAYVNFDRPNGGGENDAFVQGQAAEGVAVDRSTNHVFVDRGNGVAEFLGSNGEFLGSSGEAEAGELSGSEGVAVEESSGRLFASAPADGSFDRYGPGQTAAEPVESGEPFAAADGRGFELVSPSDPESDSAEFGVPFPAGGFTEDEVEPQRAASGGKAIGYPSFTALGEAPGAPPVSYYLSRRGSDGWTTQNITAPSPTQGLSGPIRGFSEELGFSAVVSSDSSLAPGAVPNYENLYLRDNASGALRAITTEAPTNISPGGFCVVYRGSSADGDHVIFAANGALTPDAPAAPDVPFDFYLYEWSPLTGIALVSVLPDGTPATPGGSTGFGPAGGGGTLCGNEALQPIAVNPISADGSRIFWTSQESPDLAPVKTALYARLDGTRTVQLDESRGGEDEGGEGKFLAATPDGSKAFFSDPNRLLPGAGSGDLYAYDLDNETLSDLTPGTGPAEVQGMLGASHGGSYVYFVADGHLAAGAVAGKPNLYLWHEGAPLSFIATLAPEEFDHGDERDWNLAFRPLGLAGGGRNHASSVSADGLHAVFSSVEPLTGYDNRIAGHASCEFDGKGQPSGSVGCPEIFIYDAGSGKLRCASCDPTGARPTGEPVLNNEPFTRLAGWTSPDEESRFFSAEGNRVFFETYAGLVPRDTNRHQDVYEFEDAGVGSCSTGSASYSPSSEGCVFLISTGSVGDNSYFLDAGSKGKNAFFSTRAQLVPQDRDERFDVYDARVGGGFPPPPAEPDPCSGESSCRSSSTPLPVVGSPGSSTAGGAGNFKACPAKKVRRHGRCVKPRPGKTRDDHGGKQRKKSKPHKDKGHHKVNRRATRHRAAGDPRGDRRLG